MPRETVMTGKTVGSSVLDAGGAQLCQVTKRALGPLDFWSRMIPLRVSPGWTPSCVAVEEASRAREPHTERMGPPKAEHREDEEIPIPRFHTEPFAMKLLRWLH